jgi:histidinol-phosphate aminotransferase
MNSKVQIEPKNDFPPPPRDAVRNMEAYVPGEQPADPDIVKLNTNEFPYPPPESVLEAVRKEAADSLRKYPNPACAPLRRALAEECGVPPEWIFVGNGSDEVLRLVFQAYLEPGDEVAAADPTYSLYPVLAAMFEARYVEHPAGPDGELPDSLFEASPRVFVIANPNPPIGALYPAGELARLAEKRGSLLVIDEAYVAFAERDCADMVREHPNVLVSRTFSKSHALAGLRIGYAISRPGTIEALDKIRDSYNVNRVSQAAALAALGAKDYYRAKAKEIAGTRERLRDGLLAMGYEVPRSSGNFLFVRCGDGKRLLNALRKCKILARHFDSPGLRDGARITIGTPEEIDRLLDALRHIPIVPEKTP